jgi:uncharacterized repeat protein (TIGR03803 family)
MKRAQLESALLLGLGFLALAATASARPSFALASAISADADAREVYRYSFGATATAGTSPSGPLVEDAAGSFYGVTSGGGVNFAGTVFRLTPSMHGTHEQILFNFGGSAGADQSPVGGLLG